MVQEELRQRQVVRAEVSPQEEVAAEPAVEVLHQRTSPDRPSGQLNHRSLDVVESTAKLLLEGRVLAPAPWVALVTRNSPKELAEQFHGDLELPPKPLQFLVEHACEGQQVISLILEQPTDR